jgi:hypothetical protein
MENLWIRKIMAWSFKQHYRFVHHLYTNCNATLCATHLRSLLYQFPLDQFPLDIFSKLFKGSGASRMLSELQMFHQTKFRCASIIVQKNILEASRTNHSKGEQY